MIDIPGYNRDRLDRTFIKKKKKVTPKKEIDVQDDIFFNLVPGDNCNTSYKDLEITTLSIKRPNDSLKCIPKGDKVKVILGGDLNVDCNRHRYT